MVYDPSRFQKVKLKTSPTLRYNNLSVGGDRICYTDDYQIHLISQESISSNSEPIISQAGIKDSNMVYQSKFLTMGDSIYLVLATDAGIQIWDALGNNILFNFAIPSTGKIDANQSRPTFARGITSIVTAEETEVICVGSSAGAIYVFEGAAYKFKHVHTLTEHVEPVTDIASDSGARGTSTGGDSRLLASADESGYIVLWDALSSKSITKSSSIQLKDKSPCVAVVVRDKRLVCGHSSGVIYFYNLKDNSKYMEVNAHPRFMAALSVHPTRDLIATCAEDSTLQVFTLPQVGEKIKNLLTLTWADSMLTGVVFCGPGSNNVAAVAYDTEQMRVWIAP
mmetsp:Transcript_28687/g.39631  ORF Transcript_28687/g.39631 Transcript_28687/m.39631 type:complete len:338 (-) Transcript_28687:136-1149(-)|eukprot:CAMPEP_0196588834 /NCGR_PEP_ID=MMETSP1081-20130531/61868_1 /TAXON_ID=36882 /ORGANISM="Pyramimonas amylifera, Strain CCMP720" /LENGTH=337 /DNA_ID=CAMNT_0041911459 /DNA_START=238 /DNA_END=1251 /DNA_ORIENTATION=+